MPPPRSFRNYPLTVALAIVLTLLTLAIGYGARSTRLVCQGPDCVYEEHPVIFPMERHAAPRAELAAHLEAIQLVDPYKGNLALILARGEDEWFLGEGPAAEMETRAAALKASLADPQGAVDEGRSLHAFGLVWLAVLGLMSAVAVWSVAMETRRRFAHKSTAA
jgi:hypothetical protein